MEFEALIDKYAHACLSAGVYSPDDATVLRLVLQLALQAQAESHAADIKQLNAAMAADRQTLAANRETIAQQADYILIFQTREDRLLEWFTKHYPAVELAEYNYDVSAAIITTLTSASPHQVVELQEQLAAAYADRDRLKRQMADLENTIAAVREVEMARPAPPSIVKVTDVGTLTIHHADLVTHPNGNGKSNGKGTKPAPPVTPTPRAKRTDFAGTNAELRDQVYAAINAFYKQTGRMATHNDWKAVGPANRLPLTASIENRLGMRWSAIVKAALQPNAINAASVEVKAEDAEATFRSN